MPAMRAINNTAPPTAMPAIAPVDRPGVPALLLLSAAEADDDVDDRLVLEDVPVLAVLAEGLADDREA